MAKVALLIGVSEYEPGLAPLPATIRDVEAMKGVLLDTNIGGFDEVTLLVNPQQHEMGVAIQTLFDGRQLNTVVAHLGLLSTQNWRQKSKVIVVNSIWNMIKRSLVKK